MEIINPYPKKSPSTKSNIHIVLSLNSSSSLLTQSINIHTKNAVERVESIIMNNTKNKGIERKLKNRKFSILNLT